jgi:hypothetical protein
MPVLKNIRHESFCRNMLTAKARGLSQARAYQMSGYDVDDDTARMAASRLMTKDSVRQRIAELMAPAAAKKRVDVSAAALIDKSESLIERGLALDQLNAVGKGIELQGKLGGALIDRVEVGGVGAFGQLQTLEDVARFCLEAYPDDALTMLDALREAIVRMASDEAKLIAPDE